MRVAHHAANAEDRRRSLREFLVGAGTARPQELADRFGVSLVTIHRDLDLLVEENVVRKHHGRVTALPVSAFENNVLYRRQLAVTEKQEIARAAVEHVEPGMSVVVDDSTTTAALVPLLEQITPLTVITNAQEAIVRLMGAPDIQLIALGGEYHPEHDAFVGAPCAASARSLHADLGFFSFGGIAASGVYHQDHVTVMTKRALLDIPDRRILLADHLKLGRCALLQVTRLSDFERMVTDAGADRAVLAELAEQGIVVDVAANPAG